MNNFSTDILYQAAYIWQSLTEYRYELIYGYKKHLYTIHLTFSLEEFPHLAGFHYLKDIVLPRYNAAKIVPRILDKTITLTQLQSGMLYETMVYPRLDALARLKDSLDQDFTLFAYTPKMYPFYTSIQADYLIFSKSTTNDFVFIIKSNDTDNYLCCSMFKQGKRDYQTNQRQRTLLKKTRVHMKSNTRTTLLDKLK